MVSMNQKDTTFTKIFVGGLPYHTTDETLRKFFERFGEIEEAVVITDRTTGKSRGYGFVTMATKEAAQEAIRDPNPVIDGRKANVNLAYLGAKPRNSNVSNLANSAAALAAANTVIHLGAAYPSLQTYGLQPLIYPTHNLLGTTANNLFSYGANANQSMVNSSGAGGMSGNGTAATSNATTPAGGSQPGSSAASQQAALAANAGQFATAQAYDLVNQYNQIQLEAALAAAAAAQQQSFPYGSAAAANGAANSAVAAGSPAALSAAATLANALNPNNIVNYSAYAALAQQAMPSLTAYQQ